MKQATDPQAPVGGQAAPETDDQKALRLAIIDRFSDIIKGKRKDAIEARRASGIETIWTEDEEHYDGVDDSNRASTTLLKGRNASDGLTEKRKDTSTRSTVFLKVTRPYVDAAGARVSDMLLPTDERNFAIKPTPRPELTRMLQDASPAQAAQPPQQPQGGLLAGIKKMFAPSQPAATNQPQTVADIAGDTIRKAIESAKRAQEEIDDYLTECRYHAEVRKVIEGAAKVGCGILKGPHPVLKRNRAATKTDAGWAVEMVEKIAPTSRFVNHWNFYPDGSCGDDIQRGSYTFECDDIAARGLLDLQATPGYISEAIDACITEGPTSPVDGTRKNKPDQRTSEKDLFQIWYFYGQVSKKDMEAAGCTCGDKETYPAMVTMVNDRVIKVTLSPLDSGEFPYDVMVWQARIDHWAGVGVSRQMRECQKGANAAVRNLMDNAGLSAGPQIIIDRSKIIPANGKWELAPRKVWYTAPDEENVDVTKAFMIVNIATLQSELMEILKFWLKEAEDVTGLPMLLQGQQGTAPDTVGGMEMLHNNGSTVLRRIARTFDDRVTEPHIGRYYEWLLLYGNDDSKGEFQIEARGSSALVERDLQAQALPQIIQLSLNPAFGLDPEEVISEVLKSMRLDVKQLKLSDEKKAKLAQQPPPEAPQVSVAKINAATTLHVQDMKDQSALQQVQAEAAHEQQLLQSGGTTPHMASATAQIERERIRATSAETIEASRASAEAARAQKEFDIAQQNGQFKIQEMELQKEIALLQYATQQKVSLDTVKAQLAKSAMDNQTKRELAAAEIQLAQNEGAQDRAVDLHKHHNPSPSLVRDEVATDKTP